MSQTYPQPQKSSNMRGCLIATAIIIGCIILCAVGTVVTGLLYTPPKVEEAEMTDIHPEVKASLVELSIINKDPFSYESIEIVLNPSIMGSGHAARIRTLPPGRTSTIPLINFADDENRRFNPLTTKLVEVRIFARAQGRDAVEMLRF